MPSKIPNQIQSILEDLYKQDPSLREKETELIPLIEKLLALRPKAELSPTFRKKFGKTILDTHQKLYPQSPESSPSFLSHMTNLFQWKYAAIPIGAIAIVAIMARTLPPPSSPIKTTSLFPSSQVTSLSSPQAFGSLSSLGTSGLGHGSGGGVAMAMNPIGISASKEVAQDARLIEPAYEITNYKYTYKGELPTWESQVNVYKRTKGASQNTALTQSLARTTSGLANLENIPNLDVQAFTLNQNTPYGYSITVDLSESLININQNYRAWPHPEATCRDEACFQRLRLQPSDIPNDEEVISLANNFLSTYGVSTEKYGTPIVNNDWRKSYELTQDKSQLYIPDVLTVAYPIMLEGKTAYDEGGFPYGLMVNVNVRERKVDSMWNLTTNTFESSSYSAETNQDRIRAVIEKGGLYGFSSPEAKKTIEIELDTPELVLEKIWMPREGGQTGDELLIPALRFNVKNKPANTYAPNQILVPLVKDILDQQRNGDVRIMM